jgi:phage-related protein
VANKGNKGFKGFNAQLLTAAMTLKYVGTSCLNLLSPALDAVGIFDFFSLVLMDFFMPVIEPLADILYGIGDFFMNCPDWLKIVVGLFVLLAGAVGLILGPLAWLALGFTAVITFLGGVASAVLGAIAAVIFSVGAPILILIGVLALLYLAWTSNFLGIQQIVGNVINWIIGTIQTFVQIFQALLSGNFSGATQLFTNWFSDTINGMVNFAKNIGTALYNGLAGLVGWIGAALWGLIPDWLKPFITAAAGAVGWVANAIGGAIGGIFHGGYISGDKDYVTKQGLLYEGTGGQGTNNYAPNISINANINNSMDIKALGDQLNEYMYNEYRRLR